MQGERFGNPFIFENIINYLKYGKEPENLTNEKLLKVIIKHLNLEIEEKGEYTGIREMRKHIAWYTKGLKNSSSIRNHINTITSKEELEMALTEYFN